MPVNMLIKLARVLIATIQGTMATAIIPARIANGGDPMRIDE
jgi:hypothetical protein